MQRLIAPQIILTILSLLPTFYALTNLYQTQMLALPPPPSNSSYNSYHHTQIQKQNSITQMQSLGAPFNSSCISSHTYRTFTLSESCTRHTCKGLGPPQIPLTTLTTLTSKVSPDREAHTAQQIPLTSRGIQILNIFKAQHCAI